MTGSTPKQRAKAIEKVLRKIYDEYGKEANVIDVLADLRHLCDANKWDFKDLDRTAYIHYFTESVSQNLNDQPKKG